MATTYQPLLLGAATVGTSNIPTLNLIQTTPATPTPAFLVYQFNDTTMNALYWTWKLRRYGSGNLSLNLGWYAAATTGNVVWGAQIGVTVAGTSTTTYIAKTFATATTTTTAANGTTNRSQTSTVTISNLDSLADGNDVMLRLYRDAANGSDTMTGDAIMVTAELTYSDV